MLHRIVQALVASATRSLFEMPSEYTVAGPYTLGRLLGKGSFAEVYEGTDKDKVVAIKLEAKDCIYPQLLHEAEVYARLTGGVLGVPQVHWFGELADHHAMALELLGPSLGALFNACERRFSLKTVLMLADQMISRLQYIHSRGIVHCYLSPENFCLGMGQQASLIKIIDFGLAEKYMDPATGTHIPFEEHIHTVHNGAYSSIRSHKGARRSCRDDLESLGYILVYFLTGTLPWLDLPQSWNVWTRKARLTQIKLNVTVDTICQGLPPEFALYINTCRRLGYSELPEYAFLREVFDDLMRRKGFQRDSVYDWNELNVELEAARAAAAAAPLPETAPWTGIPCGSAQPPTGEPSEAYIMDLSSECSKTGWSVGASMASPGGELTFTNLEELQELAKPLLPPMVFHYYRGGADGEITMNENRRVWGQLRLLPTIMRDVSKVDTSTTLLGEKLVLPLLIAPMAMQKMAHPDGELAVAQAAANAGIPMIQSTMGTTRLDRVAEAARGAPAMMFQLYVFTHRDNTVRLIKEAEAAGYKALCFTVDCPVLGNREDDTKNSFKLPEYLQLANLPDLEQMDRELKAAGKGSNIAQMGSWHDGSLTWDFVAWIRTHSRLPIFVKGILSPSDAERALEAGVDGIVISNHGGRQLDQCVTSLEMLPAIVQVVQGRVPVLLDGGVRRGTDIIKALALGADAVLVGRPILYALTLGGQPGVERALDIMRREFELSMALMGCPTVKHLNRSLVLGPWQQTSRL